MTWLRPGNGKTTNAGLRAKHKQCQTDQITNRQHSLCDRLRSFAAAASPGTWRCSLRADAEKERIYPIKVRVERKFWKLCDVHLTRLQSALDDSGSTAYPSVCMRVHERRQGQRHQELRHCVRCRSAAEGRVLFLTFATEVRVLLVVKWYVEPVEAVSSLIVTEPFSEGSTQHSWPEPQSGNTVTTTPYVTCGLVAESSHADTQGIARVRPRVARWPMKHDRMCPLARTRLAILVEKLEG